MEVIEILSMGTSVHFFCCVSLLFFVVVGTGVRKLLRAKHPWVPRAT